MRAYAHIKGWTTAVQKSETGEIVSKKAFGGGHCGCSMSSFLWFQPTDRWCFFCLQDWSKLPKNDPLYLAMEKQYGAFNGGKCPAGTSHWFTHECSWTKGRVHYTEADEFNWPNLHGCGGKFVPWAKGATKLIEFQGRWTAEEQEQCG